MTRQDILNEFTVDENGIIRDLGKFEGEMLYVPYFWDAFLNGFADDDDGQVLSFDVTDDDRKEFPELADEKRVQIYQRDDGFVCAA